MADGTITIDTAIDKKGLKVGIMRFVMNVLGIVKTVKSC